MKISIYSLLFLVSSICYSNARTSESLKVQIDDGGIVGRWMTSISGKDIRAFMGIPYAQPPIGELRFKAPQKVKPWGKLNLLAHKEPPMCTQFDIFGHLSDDLKGQEDCLYLNVYTPEISDDKKKAKKWPVMVWFHGGGWVVDHGGYKLYGPEFLLEQDVVLVTGNYRLGPIGFLSTEDNNAPGNFGLKDHVAILEWVQKNIEKFGGDKKSVTIFGESAGGASVQYLMVSPSARGLFHRGISQSGTLVNFWAGPPRKGFARSRAIQLAEKMDCATSSMKEMVECLRKVPAEKITLALRDFMEWENDPVIAFQPVLEKSDQEEKPFITDLKFNKLWLDIPWMLGITSEDGLFKTSSLLNDAEKLKDLETNWRKLFPIIFYYDHLPENEITEINEKIYEFYFKDEILSNNKDNLTNLMTDVSFMGMNDNIDYRLRNGDRKNTFVYLFTHKGATSYSEFKGGKDKFYGTAHCDDLLYLFPQQMYHPQFIDAKPTAEDRKLIKIMTKLWVDFATHGNPTAASEFPQWTPATKFPLDFMQIGNENGKSKDLLQMKRDFYPERAQFWMNLRKQFNLDEWKLDSNEKVEL